MLTRDVLELVVSSFAFLILGMFFGNLIMVVIGLFPIIFLAISLLIGMPEEVKVERRGEDLKVWVDGQVEDSLNVQVRGGVGLVTVGDTLPKSFRLDEGTNIKVIWKGMRDTEAKFGWKATCAKRGLFELPPVSWEARHPLAIPQISLGEHPAPRTFIVQPRPLFVRRLRQRKTLTKIPMPMEARIKFGVPTNDFLEIRDYTSGDSYKKINWKVTARLLSASPHPLQVNEYEREGKKVVWIFLNSASQMALGTSVKNTLEYAVQATLGLTRFYLGRDCRVGFCIYDNDASIWEGTFQRTEPLPDLEPALDSVDQMEETVHESEVKPSPSEYKPLVRRRILFPDLGRRQQFKIMRQLLNVEIRYSDESLTEAIHTCRGHIIGTRPLFMIITMIDAAKTKGLLDGIRTLHKYSGRLRERPTIILFNVRGYSVAAHSEEEKIAADILEFHNKPVFAALERMGVTVVNWNPRVENFTRLLLEQRV